MVNRDMLQHAYRRLSVCFYHKDMLLNKIITDVRHHERHQISCTNSNQRTNSIAKSFSKIIAFLSIDICGEDLWRTMYYLQSDYQPLALKIFFKVEIQKYLKFQKSQNANGANVNLSGHDMKQDQKYFHLP